jgi:hypothetical protein
MNPKTLYALWIFLLWFCDAEHISSKDKISFQILSGKLKDDPFALLSEEELQREWSTETEDSLLSKISKLDHIFEEFIQVDVKLVGFNVSDENGFKVDKVTSPLSSKIALFCFLPVQIQYIQRNLQNSNRTNCYAI